MPGLQNVKYEKRERPAPTPTNPTLTQLLGARDRSNWVKVTIPMQTTAHEIAYQPICLNTQQYEPGQTYTVPPLVAEELNAAVRNYEESIVLQYRKGGQHKKAGMPQFDGFGDTEVT